MDIADFIATLMATIPFQSPPVDPGRMMSNLLTIVGRLAIGLGAFGLALYAVSEIFNDRRDMRNVVMSVVGIVVLVVIAIYAEPIIRWLAQQMGAQV